MEHIDKTIADIEAKIAEHEQSITKLRSTVNDLCAIKGAPPKYELGSGPVSGGSSAKGGLTVKPDEYYGKPLATAVKAALNTMRFADRAPASIDSIYELLVQGGFDFPTKSKDANIQSLSISIGKNSDSFVKLSSGLIACKDWYEGTSTSRRPRLRVRGASDGAQTEEPADDNPDPAQASGGGEP